MLKLTLRPGEYIGIGDEIRVVFSGGSANNIHLLIDAPREMNIARSSAGGNRGKTPYYKETGISDEAKREITQIIRRERRENRAGSAESRAAGSHTAGASVRSAQQ